MMKYFSGVVIICLRGAAVLGLQLHTADLSDDLNRGVLSVGQKKTIGTKNVSVRGCKLTKRNPPI